MRKTCWLLALATTVALTTSCKREFFDPVKVEEILEYSFHNDKVDPLHDWKLTQDWLLTVHVDVTDVSRVAVLSENPYESTQSEVLASWPDVTSGSTVQLNFTTPKVAQQVFVAAVTGSGQYKLQALKLGSNNEVTLSDDNTVSGTQLKVPPMQQEIVYCYCNSYPQPSPTWGYNDLVMQLSKEVRDSRTLRINVTLAAIGSPIQMAGALQLAGIAYDDIEDIKVTPERGFIRQEAYREYGRALITDEETLLRGRNGDAVINLFDDAQAAFLMRKSNTGSVARIYVNVSRHTDITYNYFSPYTVSYDITFRRDGMAQTIGFDKLDPFIAYNYNSAIWEIHKYAYKEDEALFEYYGGHPENYRNGFCWALEIPYSAFRYPLAGESMGSYKNEALYGAYQRPNHSFGEWGADKTRALDWYLYPNNNMVY